jgi:hypothetical protein
MVGCGPTGARTGSNWRERYRFAVFDCRAWPKSHVSFPKFPLLSPAPPFLLFFSPLPITIISNMARGRKPANGTSPAPAADSRSDSTPTPPPRSILPIRPTTRQSRDVVKVNNASPTELKNALDDAIKRVRIVIVLVVLSPNNVIRTHLIVPFPTRSFQTNSYPH